MKKNFYPDPVQANQGFLFKIFLNGNIVTTLIQDYTFQIYFIRSQKYLVD